MCPPTRKSVTENPPGSARRKANPSRRGSAERLRNEGRAYGLRN
ncbi:hypothetical protein DWUX_1569 [Desulfovibrio diazotrophicus]|nr:hypothetical protein DWUX_1569 [Desulfovibrio diazotrophicus]